MTTGRINQVNAAAQHAYRCARTKAMRAASPSRAFLTTCLPPHPGGWRAAPSAQTPSRAAVALCVRFHAHTREAGVCAVETFARACRLENNAPTWVRDPWCQSQLAHATWASCFAEHTLAKTRCLSRPMARRKASITKTTKPPPARAPASRGQTKQRRGRTANC